MLIDSVIRTTRQLAASSDITTRSMANRMLSELTQLRRGLPTRRLHDNPSGASSAATPEVQPIKLKIPSAFAVKAETHATSWDDLTAIRDALDGGEIEWQAIIDLHRLRTRQRLAAHKTVLCLYGELERESGRAEAQTQPCLSVNSVYAVTPRQEPLGLIDAWADSPSPRTEQHATAGANRAYEKIAEMATALPDSRLVFVAPCRFELVKFAQRIQTEGTQADWLTCLPAGSALIDDPALWERVGTGAELGDINFSLYSTAGRALRETQIRLWAKRLEISSGGEKLWATCLLAREVDLTSDQTLMEWRLISNRGAPDLASATELMEWWFAFEAFDHYAELAQRALHVDCVQPAASVAADLILACRVAQLAWHARVDAEFDARLFFSGAEIHGLALLTKRDPADHITLADMLNMVAELGGADAWRDDADTGFEAIVGGLRRLSDAVAMLQRLAT